MVLLANPKYAAMVMDARSGEILHSENANKRLHPASLTKMMTLYVVFQAVENGEISLDKEVKISRHAPHSHNSIKLVSLERLGTLFSGFVW